MKLQYSIDNNNWYNEYYEGFTHIRGFDGKRYYHGPVTEVKLSNGDIHKGLLIDDQFYSDSFGCRIITK